MFVTLLQRSNKNLNHRVPQLVPPPSLQNSKHQKFPELDLWSNNTTSHFQIKQKHSRNRRPWKPSAPCACCLRLREHAQQLTTRTIPAAVKDEFTRTPIQHFHLCMGTVLYSLPPLPTIYSGMLMYIRVNECCVVVYSIPFLFYGRFHLPSFSPPPPLPHMYT